MTYDHWKTTESDDGDERPEQGDEPTLYDLHIREIERLRASHDRILAAAKEVIARHQYEPISSSGVIAQKASIEWLKVEVAAAFY